MTIGFQDYFLSGWGLTPTQDINVAPTVTKISRVSGKDISTFSFTADADYQAYQIRAVPATNSLVTTGVLIESGGGGAASVQRDVDVTDDEMVDATLSDGSHIVKVFVQNFAGHWST